MTPFLPPVPPGTGPMVMSLFLYLSLTLSCICICPCICLFICNACGQGQDHLRKCINRQKRNFVLLFVHNMTNYNCSKLHEKQLLLQCKIYIEGVEGDESKI